jgi:hypothetical protein
VRAPLTLQILSPIPKIFSTGFRMLRFSAGNSVIPSHYRTISLNCSCSGINGSRQKEALGLEIEAGER